MLMPMNLLLFSAAIKVYNCANSQYSSGNPYNEFNIAFNEEQNLFLPSTFDIDSLDYDANDQFNDIDTKDVSNHNQYDLQFLKSSHGNRLNSRYDVINKNSNRELILQSGNNRENLCESSIMASSINFFSQNEFLSITQDHIDFLENIIKDINAEAKRQANDKPKRNFLNKSSLCCTKLLEDFKNFKMKKYTSFEAFFCRCKAKRAEEIVKNLNLMKETKYFLVHLFYANNISLFIEEYYRDLISHIDNYLNNRSMSFIGDYQNEKSPLEKPEKIIKRKNTSIGLESNIECNDDSNQAKKTCKSKSIVFKKILFSKNHLYFLYYDPERSLSVLLKYNYKLSYTASNFSDNNLNLSLEKIGNFARCLKTMFLDSDGTFYILLQHHTPNRKCSYIKKIEEGLVFQLNTKINEKEDLTLEEVMIDNLYLHLDKLYLLDTSAQKILIFGKNFRKIHEIKFDYNNEIFPQSSKILFAIKEHIVVIINATVFIWKIDSNNHNFTKVVDNRKKYKFFNFALFYENNKFICRCFRSNVLYVYEIEDIDSLPCLKCLSETEFPESIKQKNFKIFKIPDHNEIYCAYFENRIDLTIQNIGSISNI